MMNCYFSCAGFLWKSHFGVKINDFRATGELLTCTGSSAGHREPLEDLVKTHTGPVGGSLWHHHHLRSRNTDLLQGQGL